MVTRSWANSTSSTSSSTYNSTTANVNYSKLFDLMKEVKVVEKDREIEKKKPIKKDYMFNPDDLDLEGIK